MATTTIPYEKLTDAERALYLTRAYVAVKVESGLYIQTGDDGETQYAVAKLLDGQCVGLDESWPEQFYFWSYGKIDPQRARQLATSNDFDGFVGYLRDCADTGSWYKTKRDAICAALAESLDTATQKEGQ